MIDRDELQTLYWDQELSLQQVADRLSVSPKTVRNAMDRLGIPTRSAQEATRLAHKSTASVKYRDKEWLRRAYHDEKMSLSQIAGLLNCDHSTISKWMARHGIPTRDAGEALRLRGRV